jgi:predicted RNA-binding protein
MNAPAVSDQKTYWVQVFNENTWREFLDFGGRVTGFRQTRWRYIQQVKMGDVLLCYMSRHSKWVGILEVDSAPYLDLTPIWKEDLFPCRAEVKVIAALPIGDAIPIRVFKDQLSIFHAKNWSLYFINSPSKWKREDAVIVEAAILRASGSSSSPSPDVRP